MAKQGRPAGEVQWLIVLIASFSLPLSVSPAMSQDVTPEAKSAMQEILRLWNEPQRLHAAGKLPEAIATAEAMLAVERRSLPANHPNLAPALGYVSGLYLEREDFAAARDARLEALEILRKHHGETFWRVTDARLALQDAERQAAMGRAKRQQWAEADRLNQKVDALCIGRTSTPRRRS